MTICVRRPIKRAVWAAVACLTILTTALGAAAGKDRTNLVPANSAFTLSVPDTKAFWTAWKANAIYTAAQQVMASPSVAEKLEQLNEPLGAIEKSLGFKLSGDTISTVFSDLTVYVIPGENAGQANLGIVLGIGDKAKFQQMMTVAEKAVAGAMGNGSESSSDSPSTSKSSTSSESSESSSDTEGTKKPAAKKTSEAPEGGADEDDTPKTAAKKSDTASESGESAGAGAIQTETYKGVTVKRVAPDDDTELFYAVSGDIFLATKDRAEMKALIDRQKGGAGETLATNEGYKKASEALASAPGEIYVYSSSKSTMEMNQSESSVQAMQDILKKLLATDFSASSIKINPTDISARSYGVITADSPAAAMLKKYPGNKALEIVGFAPAEPVVVMATSLLDPDLYYSLVGDLMSSMGTPDFEEKLKEAESNLGFSIKDDLIAAVGNEAALLVNTFRLGGASGAQVDGALVVRVRDKARMNKVLAAIDSLVGKLMAGGADESESDSASKTKKSAGGFKTKTAGGATIKYLDSPQFQGYTPGYVLAGDYLVLGSTQSAMAGLLDVKAGTKPGLAESDAFKGLAPRITTKANGLQYMNFATIWAAVRPLTMFAGDKAGDVQKVLDALEVIQSAAATSSLSGEGVVTESILQLKK